MENTKQKELEAFIRGSIHGLEKFTKDMDKLATLKVHADAKIEAFKEVLDE